MSYNENYRSFPVQRVKSVLTMSPELAASVKRRPIEVLQGIDENGDWMFGLELRVINEIVLAKMRALSSDGVSILVSSCALKAWPESVEVKHVLSDSFEGTVGFTTLTFGYQDLELDTIGRQLNQFMAYAPDERDLISPWVSFALSA